MYKVLTVILFSSCIFCQIKTFEIIKDSENIGSLTVKKNVELDTTFYILNAKMSFDYLYMSQDYTQNARWKISKDDFSYEMDSDLSGKKTQIRINKVNGQYQFTRDSFLSSDRFIISEKMDALFIELYFSKANSAKIFSSNFGKSYQMEFKENSFYYETDKNNWTIFYDENDLFIEAHFDGFIDYKLVDNSQSNEKSHDN